MKLGTAYVDVKADLDRYKPGLDKARSMTRTATGRIQKRIDSINFKRAGLAVAAFGGIATAVFAKVMKDAVKAANEQEAAEKRLESVIRSTGKAAGFTADEMYAMAASMQRVTTVGDEVIIAGQAILATFKEIRGEAFEKTMMAALDMSEVMQQDLRSSVVMLGKALNDPIANLSALSRSGVQFTKDQKETIKTLWSMGEISRAQAVILKELESQFGGAARAARDRFGGATKAAQNALGDLKEEIGFTITKSDEFTVVMKDVEQSLVDAQKWVKEHREEISEVALKMLDWTKNAGELIKLNLPMYFDAIETGLKDIWNVITYDPAIIEWGLVGLAIGGKKGAAIFGSLGHMKEWLKNLSAAMGMASAGLIDWSDIATANFSELKEIVEKFNKEFKYITVNVGPGAVWGKVPKQNTEVAESFKSVTAEVIAAAESFDNLKRAAELTLKQIASVPAPDFLLLGNVNKSEVIRGQHMQSSQAIMDMINANKDAAEEVTLTYETAGSRIRDAFVSAFIEIGKSGKITMKDVAQSMMQTTSQVTAQLAVSAAASGNMYAAAGLGAASIGTGLIASAMGDKGPTAWDKLEDRIEDLTGAIENWTEDVDRSLYILNNNLGDFGVGLYDATKRYENITGDLQGITDKFMKASHAGDMAGGDFQQFMDWMQTEGLGLSAPGGQRMGIYEDILDASLESYTAFLKEVKVLTAELLEDIQDFRERFYPKTAFEKAREDFEEEYGKLAGDAYSDLAAYYQSGINIKNWTALRDQAAVQTPEDILGWNIDDMALWSSTQPTGPGSEFYRKVNDSWKLMVDAAGIAWENASEGILATIQYYQGLIDAEKEGLLSDEELTKFGSFVEEHGELLDAIIADFEKKRADIMTSVERYMGDLFGTTTALDASLISLDDRFRSWLDSLIDAGATLSEQTDLFNDWRDAYIKTVQQPFESLLKTVQDSQTALSRSSWGVDEWFAQGLAAWTAADAIQYDPNRIKDEDYFAELIPLYEDQLEALRNIEQYAEQELAELETAFSAIQDLITNIAGGGDLAPVSSAEFWTKQYDKLLTDAMTGDAEAITAFEQFVPDFLKFMQAYTPDYKGITDYVTQDLNAVGSVIEDSMSELELLTDTNSWLSDIHGTLEEKLQGIIDSVLTANLGLQELIASAPVYTESQWSPSYDPTLTSDYTGYATGGLTRGVSIAGEAGPEWIVPTYEPERSRFLQSVGVDTNAIAAAIAAKVGGSGGGGEYHIHLNMDGREVCHVVAAGLDGRSPELINRVKRIR